MANLISQRWPGKKFRQYITVYPVITATVLLKILIFEEIYKTIYNAKSIKKAVY